MHLLRVSPDNPMLDGISDKEYIGERKGLRLYAIVNDEGIHGVTAFAPSEDNPLVAELQVFINPDSRGKWFSRDFYKEWMALGFIQYPMLIAVVDDEGLSERMCKSLGWKLYCKKDKVSYYSLTKEDFIRETI